jgi:hypothetical protein
MSDGVAVGPGFRSGLSGGEHVAGGLLEVTHNSARRHVWAAASNRPKAANRMIGSAAPTTIRIRHHKTGAVALHPLQDEDGSQLYAGAEMVLAQVPRRAIPMICMRPAIGWKWTSRSRRSFTSASGMAQQARRLLEAAKLSVKIAAGTSFSADSA